MPDWDGLRIFLALSRARTLAAAARKLGIDETTVARRLARLEKEMGSALVERDSGGLALTAAGEAVRAASEEMESAALAAERRALGADRQLSGRVRVTAPEILGRYFVLPALQAVRRVALRTNSIATVLEAVRLGWGAGDLPCFVGDATPGLTRAFPGEKPDWLDVWLSVHADVQRTSRVRVLVDELARVFREGAVLLAASGS